MEIDRLVRELKNDVRHKVVPPADHDFLFLRGERVPHDLRYFYRHCGETRLFYTTDRYLKVFGPEDLMNANLRITGKPYEEDISSYWFIFAEDADGEYLSIDLHPNRLGYIYDTNHVNHALEGYTPIVALSFTEFLERTLLPRHNYYWLDWNFVGYGDAYDNRLPHEEPGPVLFLDF